MKTLEYTPRISRRWPLMTCGPSFSVSSQNRCRCIEFCRVPILTTRALPRDGGAFEALQRETFRRRPIPVPSADFTSRSAVNQPSSCLYQPFVGPTCVMSRAIAVKCQHAPSRFPRYLPRRRGHLRRYFALCLLEYPARSIEGHRMRCSNRSAA